MRDMGIDPYPAAEYEVTGYSTEIKQNFKDETTPSQNVLRTTTGRPIEQSSSPAQGRENEPCGPKVWHTGDTVRIAGRLMSKRIMGKASFIEIQDSKGRIQVYVSRDDIQEPVAEGSGAPDSADSHAAYSEIDKWILSRLNSLVKEVTEAYEAYEPTKAGRAISDFVQDDLSNWYVRLNRKRFWGGSMDADKQAAYETLYTCLKTVAQLMAPNAPFYADRLYRDLVGETVHLSEWPKADESRIDLKLERQMYLAQQATSMILSLRKRAEKNVRQPLQKAVIPTPDSETTEALLHVADLIKSEVNVKELVIVPAEQSEIRLVKKIKPQFKVLGKKVGGKMKELAAAITAMSQDDIAKMEADGQFTLLDYTLVPEDVEIITEDMPGWLVANNGILTIALDIELTDELIEEGIARELINRIQNLRKSSGLEITDRIKVTIEDRPEVHNAVLHCSEYIAGQVLATSLQLAADVQGEAVEMDGYNVNIKIEKA